MYCGQVALYRHETYSSFLRVRTRRQSTICTDADISSASSLEVTRIPVNDFPWGSRHGNYNCTLRNFMQWVTWFSLILYISPSAWCHINHGRVTILFQYVHNIFYFATHIFSWNFKAFSDWYDSPADKLTEMYRVWTRHQNTQGPILFTWIDLIIAWITVITCPVKCGVKLLIHFQTPMAAPLKFGDGYII